MAQSHQLAMVGQGIQSDAPPIGIQPRLVDGVHLRWASTRAPGFPWYGYFLLRRPSRDQKLTCPTSALRGLSLGNVGSTALTLTLGTFESDQPLVLTDDFPASGLPELDLAGRAQLTFSLAAPAEASGVVASIGFRRAGDEGLTCVDLSRERLQATTGLSAAGLDIEIDDAALIAQRRPGHRFRPGCIGCAAPSVVTTRPLTRRPSCCARTAIPRPNLSTFT